MDCKATRQLISALLDDELPGNHRKRVEDHLRHCRACQKEKEEMQSAISLLASSLPTVSPTQNLDLSRRIMERLPASRPRPVLISMRWGSLAAVILLALGLVFLLNRSTDPGEAPLAARVGVMQAGFLYVTHPDGKTEAFLDKAYEVRSGDVLENYDSNAAHLGLDVGAEIALARGTRVRVDAGDGATVLSLVGDGQIVASLDAQKVPFSVQAGVYRITALGTVFGVAFLEGNTRVWVLEGSVSAEGPGGSTTVREGEVWMDGATIEEEVSISEWAAPALPVIREIAGPLIDGPEAPSGPASERPDVDPDRVPTDIDTPIKSPRNGRR